MAAWPATGHHNGPDQRGKLHLCDVHLLARDVNLPVGRLSLREGRRSLLQRRVNLSLADLDGETRLYGLVGDDDYGGKGDKAPRECRLTSCGADDDAGGNRAQRRADNRPVKTFHCGAVCIVSPTLTSHSPDVSLLMVKGVSYEPPTKSVYSNFPSAPDQ